MRKILIAFALMTATPAFAGPPVYLSCALTDVGGKDQTHFDVTLNPDQNTASYTIQETGFSQWKLSADYTPREVIIIDNSSQMLPRAIRINRDTLAVTDTFVGSQDPFRAGTCAVVDVKKHKF
jgi:hypothetical protein